MNALCDAALKGNLEEVTELVRHGAKVNESDENGNTPLHLAAAKGNKQVVYFLLSAGASPLVPNRQRMLPIHMAAYYGYLITVRMLAGDGMGLHAMDARGRTPADIARERGFDAIVHFLENSFGQLETHPTPVPRFAKGLGGFKKIPHPTPKTGV